MNFAGRLATVRTYSFTKKMPINVFLKRSSLIAGMRTTDLRPLPDLNLKGIDWVIVGGESGPGAKPMDRAWVVDIRNQCRKAKVPFFFKQWGGTNKKKAGRMLEGRAWDEMPVM